MTLFLCAGRKLLVSSVSMEIDLVFVMVVQIVLMSVWKIVLVLNSVWDGIDLVVM